VFLNAVTDTYMKEVVLKERKEKQILFDQLQRVCQHTRVLGNASLVFYQML